MKKLPGMTTSGILLTALFVWPMCAKQAKSHKRNITQNNIHTTTPLKGIDIQKVMDYPIDEIIKRYRKDYRVSKKKAALHEQELKRYFILSAEYDDEPMEMLSHEVDNLWHTFLLFTKEYQAFCHDMFGHFIHHVPKIESDIKKI